MIVIMLTTIMATGNNQQDYRDISPQGCNNGFSSKGATENRKRRLSYVHAVKLNHAWRCSGGCWGRGGVISVLTEWGRVSSF